MHPCCGWLSARWHKRRLQTDTKQAMAMYTQIFDETVANPAYFF